MRTVSLADRPDLADAAFAIPYGPHGGPFMRGNQVAVLVRWRRLAQRWPGYTVVLLDERDVPVARGVMVPFAADVEDRERFPDGGWDQVVIWAAEDVLDGTPPDTACALGIVVHPDCYGQRLSRRVLASMVERAGASGLALIAPIRPPDKAAEPHTDMAEYASRTRSDGLPADRWLRVHVRAGGRIIGIARCSATVQAPLAQWREWTGLAFREDGPVAVPGGLVPALASQAQDVGVYVEPNVWVLHTTEARRPQTSGSR